jgi:hypothetical protein
MNARHILHSDRFNQSNPESTGANIFKYVRAKGLEALHGWQLV